MTSRSHSPIKINAKEIVILSSVMTAKVAVISLLTALIICQRLISKTYKGTFLKQSKSLTKSIIQYKPNKKTTKPKKESDANSNLRKRKKRRKRKRPRRSR